MNDDAVLPVHESVSYESMPCFHKGKLCYVCNLIPPYYLLFTPLRAFYARLTMLLFLDEFFLVSLLLCVGLRDGSLIYVVLHLELNTFPGFDAA